MTNAAYSISRSPVTVQTDVANSETIEFEDFQYGMVYVPDGSSLTTLTWYASLEKTGPFIAADDAAGNAVTQTVAAGQAHPIPSALVGARFLRITGNVAGVVGVTLKT